ncbi:hypothetical protein DNTS_003919 [Danionella cerebrum]|uniref:Aquaporin 8b n=1 Tax=Danionella cerebrum TaxID=2873325 RepID=A0A553Q438_9TELE|nr:hypothetical protein DNTS_003919 [Danionella translucida]
MVCFSASHISARTSVTKSPSNSPRHGGTMAETELQVMEKALMEKARPHPGSSARLFQRLIQPCVAELLGTAFFVLMGSMSVIEGPGRLQAALGHGLSLAALIGSMAEISGSHFNPCFTIAISLCGGLELKMVLPYLISQLSGALLGAAMAKGMSSAEKYGQAHGAAFTLLEADDDIIRALFAEMLMTCLVSMVVLMVAVNGKTKSPLAPVLVGCTVIINVFAGAGVSGACLNPARALGPAVLNNHWTHHWIYWVFAWGQQHPSPDEVTFLLK